MRQLGRSIYIRSETVTGGREDYCLISSYWKNITPSNHQKWRSRGISFCLEDDKERKYRRASYTCMSLAGEKVWAWIAVRSMAITTVCNCQYRNQGLLS